MFFVPAQQPAWTSNKRKPRPDPQQTTTVTSSGDEVLSVAAVATYQQQNKGSRRTGPPAPAAGPTGSYRRLYGGSLELKETNVGRGTMATLFSGMNSHSQSSVQQQDRKHGREPVVYYENTYRMGYPQMSQRFHSLTVERLLKKLLYETFDTVPPTKYDSAACRQASKQLSTVILSRVKELGLRRYKFVAMVTVGGLDEKPSMFGASRCLWNIASDDTASSLFIGKQIFAAATVYGFYVE